jgi:hypothetical protein
MVPSRARWIAQPAGKPIEAINGQCDDISACGEASLGRKSSQETEDWRAGTSLGCRAIVCTAVTKYIPIRFAGTELTWGIVAFHEPRQEAHVMQRVTVNEDVIEDLRRIRRQRERIERYERSGFDVSGLKNELRSLEDGLADMLEHREELARSIA